LQTYFGLAHLPEDLSPSRESDWLGNGLAEDLSFELNPNHENAKDMLEELRK